MPWPSRVFTSTGLTPAETTRTRTSVGSGTGRGTSVTRRTSGPPKADWVTARIVGVVWDMRDSSNAGRLGPRGERRGKAMGGVVVTCKGTYYLLDSVPT